MLKKQFTHSWTQIPNSIINNKEISFKAKGLWAYINSKQEGWDFAVWRIAKQTKEGEKAVRAGLNELVKEGYLRYQAKFKENGQVNGQDYILTDTPLSNDQTSDPQKGSHQKGVCNSKTIVSKTKISNKEIIQGFFDSENLKEIINENLIPDHNQVWNDRQSQATFNLVKDTMLDYYEDKKKPIKNIKLTFINWIKKYKRTDFYKYTNNPTGQISYTDKKETRSIFRQDLMEFHYYKNDYWEFPEEEQETLDLAKRNNYKIIYKS